MDKATRLMERALCETDITFDYSGAETEDTEGWVCYLCSSVAIRTNVHICIIL